MKIPSFKTTALSLLVGALTCLVAKAQTIVVSLAPTASPSGVYTLNVVYSTGMDPATSTNTANYSVTNVVGANVPISKATLAADTVTVTLTLGAPLQVGTNSLTISNVQGTNSVVISPSPTTIYFGFLANVTATFNFDDSSYWGPGPSTPTGTNNFGETILTTLTGSVDDEVLGGGLNPSGGMLQLTGNNGSEYGEWIIPDLASGAGVSNLNVSFYLVLDNPTLDPNNGPTTESDQLTFSYAPDAMNFVNGLEGNGGGTGLIVEFHTYDSSAFPGSFGAGIFVKLGGGSTNKVVLSNTNLPWLNGQAINGFTNAQLVNFSVAQDGTFNMTYGANVIFTNAVIPGWQPIAGGLMVFRAGCGATLTEDCWIDGVTISEAPMTGAAAAAGGPTDTTVPANTRATFSVAAVGATPYAYQWYSNGVVIAGATSAAYTTPYTTLAMTGQHYSVAVTNFLGGALSTNATLTVIHALPQLFSASGINNANVLTLVYDSAMNPATTTNVANYSLVTAAGTSVSITNATLAGDGVTVTLSLASPLQVEVSYTLTVQNVQSAFGGLINSNPTTAGFMFMTGAFTMTWTFDNSNTNFVFTGTNTFNQPVATTALENGTLTPPPALIIPGGFNPAGNMLQLTTNTYSSGLNQNGYWIIPDQAGGALVNDLSVTFDMVLGNPDSPATEADGTAFSFARDVATTGGHLGSGTGLIVEFHTYDDSWKADGIGKVPGIFVHLGGTTVATIVLSETTNLPWLAKTPNSFQSGASKVYFSLSSSGIFNMTYDNNVIFSNAVVAGYSPIAGGKMSFAASSGGLFENVWLDNVMIGEAPSTTPPPAPTGLTATPSLAQVSLAWTASVAASSYRIYRSTTNGGPYTQIASGVTATSYTDLGLNNGTTYYYVVTAFNSFGGESSQSAQASAAPSASAPQISFVGASQNLVSGASASVAMANNAGDTIVVAVREGTGAGSGITQSMVTDTAGNTYTLVNTASQATSRGSGLFVATNVVASANNTITFNWGTSTTLGIVAEEFANVGSVEASTTSTTVATGSTNVTTIPSGSITTTNVGDVLIYAAEAGAGQTTWTAGSGYTIPANGSNARQGVEYLVAGAPGTYSASISYNSSTTADGIYVALAPRTVVLTLPVSFVRAGSNLNTATTNKIHVTMANNAGDAIVVAVREGTGAGAGISQGMVTDTAGNTYTLINTASQGTSRGSGLFIATNVVAAANNIITFTWSSAGANFGVVAEEFANVAGVETSGTASTGSSSVLTLSSPSLTTINNGELFIFEAEAASNQGTWTAGSGYTIPSGGTTARHAMEYFVAGAAGTYSTTISDNVSASMDGVYAALAPITEVVGVVLPPLSPLSFTRSGNQLSLTWSGGSGILLESTNVTQPMSNWAPVVTNPPMPYVITMSPGTPQVFYRAK